MATETAHLVVRIDTSSGDKANRDLAQFEQAAGKAAVQAERLEDTVKDLGTATSGLAAKAKAAGAQFGSALGGYSAPISNLRRELTGAGASFGQFSTAAGRAGAQYGQFVHTIPRAVQPLKETGKAADEVRSRFGLLGHQTTNLRSQFLDIGVQLGSGGGIFRTLIQQGPQVYEALANGPKGIGGALAGIKEGFKSIPIAAYAAFGTAGVVAAIGLGLNALSNFQKELKRTEEAVRTFNSGPQADSIIGASKKATDGTGLQPADVFSLEQLAQRHRQALGLLNKDIGELTESAVKLALQMGRSEEEASKAIESLSKMLSQTVVTGQQAKEFALAYPQFAGAMAAAFDTTAEKLHLLEDGTYRTRAELAKYVIEAGKAVQITPEMGTAFGELSKKLGEAWRAFDKLTGSSAAWDSFWRNVAKGLAVVTKALEDAGAASARFKPPTLNPGAMNPGPPGVPVQNDPRGRFGPIQGASTPLVPDPGNRPGEELFGPEFTKEVGDAIAEANKPALDGVTSTIDRSADQTERAMGEVVGANKSVEGEIKQQSSTIQSVGGTLVKETVNGVNVWRTKSEETTRAVESGTQATNATTSAVIDGKTVTVTRLDQVNSTAGTGLKRVEDAVNSLPARMPRGGGGGGGGSAGSTAGGSFTVTNSRDGKSVDVGDMGSAMEWANYWARDNAQMEQWSQDGLHHGSGGTFTTQLYRQPDLTSMDRFAGALGNYNGIGIGTLRNNATTGGMSLTDYKSSSLTETNAALGSLNSTLTNWLNRGKEVSTPAAGATSSSSTSSGGISFNPTPAEEVKNLDPYMSKNPTWFFSGEAGKGYRENTYSAGMTGTVSPMVKPITEGQKEQTRVLANIYAVLREMGYSRSGADAYIKQNYGATTVGGVVQRGGMGPLNDPNAGGTSGGGSLPYDPRQHEPRPRYYDPSNPLSPYMRTAGFASGGAFTVPGPPGRDRPHLVGLSGGERVQIVPVQAAANSNSTATQQRPVVINQQVIVRGDPEALRRSAGDTAREMRRTIGRSRR